MCQALHWCWDNSPCLKKVFLEVPSQSAGFFIVRCDGYGFASQKIGGDWGGTARSSRCMTLGIKCNLCKTLLHSEKMRTHVKETLK